MAEPIVGEEERRGEEEEREATTTMTAKSRKEKRNERKKMKRKQMRIEMAEKEREEEEKRLNDPKELRRLEEMEREERERMERDQKEFEERERLWFEAMEKKRKEEEEEMERMKLLEVDEEETSGRELQVEGDDENKEDDEWEYVEEGPAEIIWQGNEIIVRKKKVRVPKRNVDQLNRVEDADRPTSNPLPPQSEAFAEYQNSALVPAQQMLENVAQQVPNFGTEQDKAHCPFHLKTGACRFGERCSRVHFYPDKACTLLIRNMYNGPGVVWEQDEGLEHTDEEVDCCYEEFYEDVHTEFLKYGELINFKVCKNSSSHLRGNVYVHYKSLDSAVLAFHSINGRYFAGKQVKCEFVNVTRWKVAICGEYMKSRLKTCSRGMTCNFIHCFRNPGGDYEWADWDKPPPRYWVKKMAALFGYSVESAYDKEMRQEMIETDRHHMRRSRSRDIHTSGKSSDREDDVLEDNSLQMCRNNGRKRSEIHDEKTREGKINIHRHHSRSRSQHNSDRRWSKSETDSDFEEYRLQGHARKRSKQHFEVSERQTDYKGRKDRTQGADPYEEWSDGDRKGQSHDKCKFRDMDGEKHCSRWEEKSRHHNEASSRDKYGDDMSGAVNAGTREEWSHKHKNKVRSHSMKRSGSENIVSELPDDHSDRCRTFGTDSSDDQLESRIARQHSHARKRLRHGEPDLSGDERATDEKSHSRDCAVAKSHLKRNATDWQSSTRIHSSRGGDEANFPSDLMKPNENHMSDHVDQHNSKHKSSTRIHSSRGSDEANFPSDLMKPNENNMSDHVDQHNSKHKSSSPNPQFVSIQGIDEQDRWQPESPETYRCSGRKSSSVDCYDSVSPDQFNRRSESRNHNSEYFQNEGGRDAQLELGNNGYERCKNTSDEDDEQYSRKSRSWDKNASDFRSKSKSRSSSRRRHKRRSRHMEKDSDSTEEHEEQEKR